jgi:hypothetical protein
MTERSDPNPPQQTEDATELSDDQLDPVAGGARTKPLPTLPKTPSPGGPVPIPYPVIGTKE